MYIWKIKLLLTCRELISFSSVNSNCFCSKVIIVIIFVFFLRSTNLVINLLGNILAKNKEESNQYCFQEIKEPKKGNIVILSQIVCIGKVWILAFWIQQRPLSWFLSGFQKLHFDSIDVVMDNKIYESNNNKENSPFSKCIFSWIHERMEEWYSFKLKEKVTWHDESSLDRSNFPSKIE